MVRRAAPAIDWAYPLRAVLDAVEPKPGPEAPRGDKKNYAENLSRKLATLVAGALRHKYPNITPTVAGHGHEIPTGADHGNKRLDVRVWNERLGLLLDVSIKTYSFQDWRTREHRAYRYTKNIVRNDHELRAEADSVHRRQPYAVLVGIIFMPAEAALDGEGTGHSSFAHAVSVFRRRTGRRDGTDPAMHLFERFYVALYESTGEHRGAVTFFDAKQSPPRNGRPPAGLTVDLQGLVDETIEEVDRRNDFSPAWLDFEDEAAEDL
jgi:hypothetical protein